jgi:hypothetical protein
MTRTGAVAVTDRTDRLQCEFVTVDFQLQFSVTADYVPWLINSTGQLARSGGRSAPDYEAAEAVVTAFSLNRGFQ